MKRGEMTEQELDAELARLAEETPEMPAGFHERWTAQIRAEAENKAKKERAGARRQWRYVLSAAAVFVFLIGGTLLTRSFGRGNSTVPASPRTNGAEVVVMDIAKDAEEDAGSADAAVMSAAAPEAEEEAYAAVMEAAAGSADAANRENGAGRMKTAGNRSEAAETALYAATESAEAMEEMEETEAPARESEFVSFLKDLGVFTLWTLGIAAAGAALAFLAARIRRALKRRKIQ